jgi:hypothetical protein
MKKKEYEKPSMQVIELQHKCQILAGSSYETTGSGGTSINAMGEETDL